MFNFTAQIQARIFAFYGADILSGLLHGVFRGLFSALVSVPKIHAKSTQKSTEKIKAPSTWVGLVCIPEVGS